MIYHLAGNDQANLFSNDEITIKEDAINDSSKMINKYKQWNGKKFNKFTKKDLTEIATDTGKYFCFDRKFYPLKYFYRNPIVFDEFLSNKIGSLII